MSKRNTVNVKIERVEQLVKQNGWSSSTFCTLMMGKQRGWITEWKRGKNFPSPDEAATICSIFGVQPEEIIVDAEDCTIVSEILAKTEKSPAPTKNAEDFVKVYELLTPDRQAQLREKMADLLKEQLQG